VLRDDEVHLWLTAPSWIEHDLRARYAGLLSPEERERAAAFVFDRDRQVYLVARALLRTVLSRYGGTSPDAWRFTKGPRGRPELLRAQNPSQLRFNLSHTRDLVALAVARVRDVGVDVEDVDRPADVMGIADRYFAGPERTALAALDGQARLERFFEHWTLKEAYVKARGDGLWLPLDSFWFELGEETPPRIVLRCARVDDAPESWRFRLLRPHPGRCGALAWRGDPDTGAVTVRTFRVVPLRDPAVEERAAAPVVLSQ
jgi:4'-phosphopantetheinyl transferase